MKIINCKVLAYLGVIGIISFSCEGGKDFDYQIVDENITVDGNVADWKDIQSIEILSSDYIRIDEYLEKDQWTGKEDLSFRWKAAHYNGKLFFLFEVQDDTLSNFDQQYAWENDCIEIHLDHQNLGGNRIIGIGPDNSLEDRLGKRLKGHELQFLPSDPPKVYLDDTRNTYYTDTDQNELFKQEWFGEIVARNTGDGYIVEIAFAIPNYYIRPGQILGLDVGICDDDGKGRKSLLIWKGKGYFWLHMDNLRKVSVK